MGPARWIVSIQVIDWASRRRRQCSKWQRTNHIIQEKASGGWQDHWVALKKNLQLPSSEYAYFPRFLFWQLTEHQIFLLCVPLPHTSVKTPKLLIYLQHGATHKSLHPCSHFSLCPPRYLFLFISFWEKVLLCGPGRWLELIRARRDLNSRQTFVCSSSVWDSKNVLDRAFTDTLQTLLSVL